MTNNELQQIKDPRERFCMTRKEIVGDSCKKIAEKSRIYRAYLERVKYMESRYSAEELETNYDYRRCTATLYHLQNPSIRERALDSLEWIGYQKEDKGTQYLATLITIFYHERKLYHRKDFPDKRYWDLEDWNNEHYGMMGAPKERVIYEILEANSHNPDLCCPFEETVYRITDSLGAIKYDENTRNCRGYEDLLSKNAGYQKCTKYRR